MKKVLSLVEDCDFSLIGMSCHAKDYRLSWEINRALSIDLTKPHEDIELPADEGRQLSIAFFFDEESHIEYTLAANNNKGELLIPEYPQLDYFIKIDGPLHDMEATNCKPRIKDIDMVLAVVDINPNELKSKLNLMF